MSIAANIEHIRKDIPESVKLLCVSKFHPIESIKEAYDAGEREMAESRPQELVQKVNDAPLDIKWHFIGNLQTNKVKMVVPHATLIHSVSNSRLIAEIERIAAQTDKIQDILIELHVAKEESKQGFTPEETIELLTPDFFKTYPHIRVCGVMGMATFTEDNNLIIEEFKTIKETFDRLKNGVFANLDYFKEISMGMSDDYKLAIEQGSTMVRIGSAIFGSRY
ncbi:MAG: YggS family pyridoxal phosphate-dependent enzyme [bacterium]